MFTIPQLQYSRIRITYSFGLVQTAPACDTPHAGLPMQLCHLLSLSTQLDSAHNHSLGPKLVIIHRLITPPLATLWFVQSSSSSPESPSPPQPRAIHDGVASKKKLGPPDKTTKLGYWLNSLVSEKKVIYFNLQFRCLKIFSFSVYRVLLPFCTSLHSSRPFSRGHIPPPWFICYSLIPG